MRQRRIKNLEAKYRAYEDILVYFPANLRGKWADRAAEALRHPARGIFLEIGCGKGTFISRIAERRPEDFFIAVEGNRSVMLRALEKVRAKDLHNVVFIPEFVDDLRDWFAEREVNGIYLNFSDPLPKNYMARKRLTYRKKLEQYFDVMTDDGEVIFKTDNTGLFEFTVQEVLASDLKITALTRDLHGCEYDRTNIRTEYEDKFSGLGEKIKLMKIERLRSREEKNMSMAALNGRTIPKEDKIFGINGRARKAIAEKGRDNVINATIGKLLDDDGNLIVLSSVDEAVKSLKPSEYADYAPIAGTEGFREAVKKAALGRFETDRFVEVVATPGGTGSIRNSIANYTCPGDRFLTHDWHWAAYGQIAGEMGRGLENFEMFDEDGNFNIFDFEYKVKKLLRIQDRLLVCINTPANNPTGYALSVEDWRKVVDVLNSVSPEKKVALVVDMAYIDYAGDEDETRAFLPELEELKDNVLPILAYSASKTFTFYGCRCAATVCMAPTREIADEFVQVMSFSSRSTWSNSPRGPQAVIEKIYADPELLARVDAERKEFRDMLLRRGRAFEEEAAKAGLEIVPFRAGFFASVPCADPAAAAAELEKKDVFVIPLEKGIRVSIASISEEKCRRVPAMIKEALDTVAK